MMIEGYSVLLIILGVLVILYGVDIVVSKDPIIPRVYENFFVEAGAGSGKTTMLVGSAIVIGGIVSIIAPLISVIVTIVLIIVDFIIANKFFKAD